MGDQCVNICQGDPADRQRAAGATSEMVELILTMGQQAQIADRPGEAGLRGARRRAGPRPGPPGRRRRQPQPRVLPAGARDRRRRRHARVGDDDDAGRPGARADRRQRRRHRRAGRLRRHRAVPGVRGRLASADLQSAKRHWSAFGAKPPQPELFDLSAVAPATTSLPPSGRSTSCCEPGPRIAACARRSPGSSTRAIGSPTRSSTGCGRAS